MEAIAHGDGDLIHRLDDQGNDEIAGLAKAYNAFVDKFENTVNTIVGTTNELALYWMLFAVLLSRLTCSLLTRQSKLPVQVNKAGALW